MGAAELRPLVVAYNDFAIAAEDAAYEVGQYQLTRAKDALGVTVQFVVFGTSATDLATKEAALDALRTVNGSLVVQQARELELDDLVGNGTTTVTSATGGFLATHVGDWLVILGVGARRITAVASSNSVTVHAAVAAGTRRAMKPARLFRGDHAARTFASARPSLAKVAGSANNTEFSRHYSLTVDGRLPYSEVNGLVRIAVGIAYDQTRRRTLTVEGEFATTTAGDARTLYTAKIAALLALHASAFGGLSIYRLTNQHEGYGADDTVTKAETAQNYTFSYTYLEHGLGDARITEESIAVTVGQGGSTSHGLDKTLGGVFAKVSYRSRILRGQNLAAFYASTIRQRISDAIFKASGDARNRQVIEQEDATFETVGSTVNASWTVLLLGRSGTLLEYAPSTTLGNDPNVFSPALWDGKPHTFAIWQNKVARTRANSLVLRSLRPLAFDAAGVFVAAGKSPFAVDAGGGFQENGLSPGDGPVKVRWPQDAGGGGAGGGGAGGAGRWMQRGAESVTGAKVEYVGQSSFGAFAVVPIYSATLSRNDVWVEDAEPFQPRFEQPAVLTGI